MHGRRTPASPRHVITERDIPALAAKHHPGQKWGYLKMHWNASDYVGEDLVVKVPNSAPGARATRRVALTH